MQTSSTPNSASCSPNHSLWNVNSNSLKSSSTSSINQRIRSQVIKAVSDNLQYDNQQRLNKNNSSPSVDNSQSIDLKLLKPKVVISSKECEEIIQEINTHCSEVAFDLEGVNLGVTGEVTLIQLAFIHADQFKQYHTKSANVLPKIYIFDVLLHRNFIDCGLRQLFESETIIKVVHDVRNLSVSLFNNFGIKLQNVFDTQAGHLIVQQQSTGKPATSVKTLSLFTLSKHYGGPNLNPKMKDRLHKIYKKDYKYWQKRPLTEEMLQFALTDVYILLPHVYGTMAPQIKPQYEPLFKQLVHESIFAHINADEVKQSKRQRKFELELTDLKMKLLNSDKKTIVLSNREVRLLR